MMLTVIVVLGVWLLLLLMVVGLCRAAAKTEAAVLRGHLDQQVRRFGRDPAAPQGRSVLR